MLVSRYTLYMSKTRSNLCNHHSLDLSSVGYMWSNAKVDHGSTSIYCGGSTIGNFGLDEVFFVFIVLRTHSDCVQKSNVTGTHTLNISNNFSLDTTNRSNFCLSLMAASETFSSVG